MLRKVKKIFELEALTGILLLIATALALIIANSQYHANYQNFFEIIIPINFPEIGIVKNLTLTDWINDFLMAIFFLLVGLELKEELLNGELSSFNRASLPLICAIGGVIFPALIFYLSNISHPQNLSGIAIPCATDIAFAYGVICLFGKKIPKSLKVFIVSLAIFDDLIAIAIIAIFYSTNIEIIYLLWTIIFLGILAILNLRQKTKLIFYVVLGIGLWLMILKSGIHASVAGVLLAIFIPRHQDCLKSLIKLIAPKVNYLILPIFAFANSAVVLANFDLSVLGESLFLGIVLGLFFGKQIGVMFSAYLAVKFQIAKLPRCSKNGEVSWMEFYGVAILTGIGFTMSFFIGNLAFDQEHILEEVKLAVLFASAISALMGIIIIFFMTVLRQKPVDKIH